MNETPFIGFIRTERNDGSEKLLDVFAAQLRNNGWNVGGLIQQTTSASNGAAQMELVDIRTSRRYLISQSLGKESSGCCLDPSGLCEASAVLRREIEAQVDILLINKFAVAEAEGQGLLQELYLAVEREIPVLTSVASRYRPDWDRIMGDCGQPIDPDLAALEQWWAAVSAARLAHRT